MTNTELSLLSDRAAIVSEEPPHARDAAGREGLLGRLVGPLRQLRFVHKYFVQLEVDYSVLCPEEYRQRTAREFAELKARDRLKPSWALVHRLEYLIIKGLPLALLRQRLPLLRERLGHLLGADTPPSVSAPFDAGKSLAAGEADPDALRTFALGVLSETQSLRLVHGEFERLRNHLLVSFLIGGALVLYMFWFLVVANGSLTVPAVPLHVVAAGLLGGYFSVLFRLGALRWSPQFAANHHNVQRMFWSMISSFALAMFEGAVGAFVLYAVFMAGLVDGALFPSFDASEFHDADLSKLFWYGPRQSGDAAKLVVWSVIAGFSERLIPDFLSSFSKRLAGKDKASDEPVVAANTR